MAIELSSSSIAANAEADQLLASGTSSLGSKEDAKVEKAGKDFESILLGSWLQKAEQSFASVPGGDDDDDEDPGKGQFQNMATQSLANSLSAQGGIGIAKMITEHLRTADEHERTAKPETIRK